MSRNDADFHRLSDAIQQIYANADELDARRHGLSAVAALLDSRQAAIIRLPLDGGDGHIVMQFGMSDFAADVFVTDRKITGSPFGDPGKWVPGWTYLGGEMGGIKNWRDTAFFRDYCRPNDISDSLTGIIEASSSEMLGVCFFRPRGAPEFGETDRSRLATLLPHWRNAFAFRDQLDRLAARANAAHGILDQAPFAIMMLDAGANVLYLNARAKKICGQNDGIGIRNGRIKMATSRLQGLLTSSLEEMTGSIGDDKREQIVFPINRPSGKSDYQFVATTISVGENTGHRPARRAAVAFLLDPSERAPLHGGALQSLHGLTDAESRVCELMYQNKSVADTASELNVSVNTAKTHLAHIFRKIGINSQNELMDYLARLPKISAKQHANRNEADEPTVATTSEARTNRLTDLSR